MGHIVEGRIVSNKAWEYYRKMTTVYIKKPEAFTGF
jgi:hypothetical protein